MLEGKSRCVPAQIEIELSLSVDARKSDRVSGIETIIMKRRLLLVVMTSSSAIKLKLARHGNLQLGELVRVWKL
jgi:hypothetical protein